MPNRLSTHGTPGKGAHGAARGYLRNLAGITLVTCMTLASAAVARDATNSPHPDMTWKTPRGMMHDITNRTSSRSPNTDSNPRASCPVGSFIINAFATSCLPPPDNCESANTWCGSQAIPRFSFSGNDGNGLWTTATMTGCWNSMGASFTIQCASIN